MPTKGLWTAGLTSLLVPVMSTVLGTGLAAQTATPGPRMPLTGLERLQSVASDVVDVSLDPGLLALAARFMDADDADGLKVKEMLSGLKGVYVRSFEFGTDGVVNPTEIEAIRRQLSAPGWTRMAGVRSKQDRADVDVYLWLDGATIGGLGILAVEPRRFTVVNIVGSIDLDQLRKLEGFGMPRLDLEKPKEPKAKPGKDAREKPAPKSPPEP